MFNLENNDHSYNEPPKMLRLLSESLLKRDNEEQLFQSTSAQDNDAVVAIEKIDSPCINRHLRQRTSRSEGQDIMSSIEVSDVQCSQTKPRIVISDVERIVSSSSSEQDNVKDSMPEDDYFVAQGGCKERRNQKKANHVPMQKSTATANKDKVVDNLLEILVLGKKRRGRAESDFKTYQMQTKSKIGDLNQQVQEAESQGNAKDMKRYKNMISAYESRLLKRAKVEDIQDQLNVRTKQLQSILKIIQRELTPVDLLQVTNCIKYETPQMVRGSTLVAKGDQQ